jgi:hypothetical protein
MTADASPGPVPDIDIDVYADGVLATGVHGAGSGQSADIAAGLDLFRDENGGGDEDSAGSVAWIRIYDGAMTPQEVAAAGNTEPLVCASSPAPPAEPPPGGELPPSATNPDTVISKGPAAKTRRRQASFQFSSSDPSATFECSLDGRGFQACVSPRILRVKRGRHLFKVRAVDADGTDPTPARYSWKVKRKKR